MDLSEEYIKNRVDKLSKLLSLNSARNIGELIGNKKIDNKYKNIIISIANDLKEVYPDTGDIQYGLVPKYKIHQNMYGSNHAENLYEVFSNIAIEYIYIVIKFPEIVITNTKNETTTIKDIFVRIPVRLNSGYPISLNTMQGARSTITIPELASNYAHSHLRKRTTLKTKSGNYIHHIDYQKFCTGSDTYINEIKSLINSKLDDNQYDSDLFKLLLYQIKTYLEWESIEGTPHISMSTIFNNQSTIEDVTIEVCMRFYTYMIRNISGGWKIDIDWKFYNGKYSIIDNERFETYLVRFVDSSMDQNFLVCKDQKGNYFKCGNANTVTIGEHDLTVDSHEWLAFRGEKVFFKVEGELKSTVNKTKYLHPKIKDYVRKRLEFQANITKIRDAAFERYSAIDHL